MKLGASWRVFNSAPRLVHALVGRPPARRPRVVPKPNNHRELERREQLTLARELYQRCTTHPARERSARILEAQENWPEVLALCDQMLREPLCEGELEAARRIQRRALRRSGAHPHR